MSLTMRVYFFMNKNDIKNYFNWLGHNFNIGFIPSGPRADPKDKKWDVYNSIDQLGEFISFDKSKYGLHMDNTFYIFFPEFKQKVQLMYIKEQKYYLISEEQSKLVRFSYGGIFKEKILISGTMDIYKRYCDHGQEVFHQDLIKRFKEMTKWFRKNHITRAANHYYVMPGAYEMAKQGMKLKVDNNLAFGFHIGASGGLEGYYEDKGLKITDDGILTSQVDWSEEAKKNIWKEFPGC